MGWRSVRVSSSYAAFKPAGPAPMITTIFCFSNDGPPFVGFASDRENLRRSMRGGGGPTGRTGGGLRRSRTLLHVPTTQPLPPQRSRPG
jgi:hypothetical protein